MTTSRRVRVAEGIYRDAHGLAATVKVGRNGPQREQRFRPDEAVDRIQAWRARIRAELLEDRDAGETRAAKDTYAADLPRYLKTIAHRVSFKSDRSHLRAWLPAIGSLRRHRITPNQIQQTINAWLQDGKSVRTVRHRRRVLRELYLRLDGERARPPLRGVKVPRPPAPHPVAVPWSTVQAVAASLAAGGKTEHGYGSDSLKGRARFLVLATTGQRPTQMQRAQPEDLDLDSRLWYVRPAKGGRSTALPLDAAMVRAWRAFIAADAWGPYDARSFAKLLRRHGWPAGVRPYALRATFAIDMIIGGADLGDVQAALGHRQIETTRAHYAAIQLGRMRQALKLRRRGTL